MKCPLCESYETKEIVVHDYWHIWACQACTNAWTCPSPCDFQYENYDFHGSAIENHSDKLHSLEDLPEQWRSSLISQILLISRYLDPGSKVLEIGCGEGIFLEELKKRGFDVSGIEPSITAVKRARMKGLNVQQGYFSSEMLDNKNFDIIVMSHVLEHMPNPSEILKTIASLLHDDGLLFLVQTNYRGLYPRLAKHKWYWVPDQHFWHFTPKGILNIIPAKCRLVECEFSSLTRGSGKGFSFNRAFSSPASFVAEVVSLCPPLQDQFHLLVRYKSN
jgi:SAM-dependent methyltransferase